MINPEIFMFIIIGIIFVMVVICLILAILNSAKINTIMDYSDEGDLVSAIEDYYTRVEELSKTISDTSDVMLKDAISELSEKTDLSLSKTGLVNFDAYDDVSGKMSFALTILNAHNNGIILTALYGHNASNTYIRQVHNGLCDVKLLEEEKLSLLNAINNRK